MISTRTLASALVVAFGVLDARSAVAAPPATRTRRARAEGEATITSLAVVPSSRSADVVIKVNGAITFKHFTLTKPDKIVVDLSNATLGLPDGMAYDGVARGSIEGIRYSQFTKSVVRVVITLDGPHSYGVLTANGD